MKTKALLLVVLLPATCAGQNSAADAAPHMVRAAGMPLNDRSLAPGTLTVRLVEGAFTRNLADQVVEIDVEGGKAESARTGPDGRAQFARLPVGIHVRASAVVAGERLESESFVMPIESGVRVLLVAENGASPSTVQASSTSVGWNAPLPAAPQAPSADPQPTSIPADTGVAVIRAVLATATVSVFGFLFLTRRPRRRHLV